MTAGSARSSSRRNVASCAPSGRPMSSEPARLPHRVVVLLVHREGEDARVGLEHERRAVAVMHVEIDDGDPLQPARLQHARGHGDVVERAEAFAVVRKRVMRSRRRCEIPNSER